MVNIMGCEGLFEPLLVGLEDRSSPTDDRVDAYLRLTDRLRGEEEVFASEVCRDIRRLVSIIKVDVQREEIDVCQAALQALGHCMYHEQIACSFIESDAAGLLKVLTMLIKSTDDKAVCTRALWCIAKQNLAAEVIATELDSILSSIFVCIFDKQLQSVTVEHEALAVIERLLLQLPGPEMIKTADNWSKVVYPLLTSSSPKVRERALQVLSAGVKHLVAAQDKALKVLLPELKHGLLKGLMLLSNEKKELFVLETWSYLVPILGKHLHRGGMLINEMLKLVEQGFKSSSVEVQQLAYSSWNALIDNFALVPEILSSPKRLKLLMMPLLNNAVKDRHVVVETARLACWWHLVCVLGSQVADLFDQVCTPLLQFLFGSDIDQVNHLRSREGFRSLRCPATPTSSNMAEKMAETPRSNVRRCLKDIGTPKTPTIKNTSFSHRDKHVLLERGCEILESLLQTDDKGFPVDTTVERLHTVVFKKPEDFRRHSAVLINTVKEAFRTCGREIKESLCYGIWSNLVDQVQRTLERGQSSDHGDVFLALLSVTQDIVDNEYVFPAMALKMLEKLVRLPSAPLTNHTACLHSKENPQGSPALLLVQLLFTQGLLTEASTNERFHVTFEHLINCGMTTTSGQFSYQHTVLNMLDKGARFINSKDTLWRLWSSASNSLNEYITKTNDVNQGDALEHDFTTMHTALTFPVKHIMGHSFPKPIAKQLRKALGELYRSFARAAALVPTAGANVCAQELCGKLMTIWNDMDTKDSAFLAGLADLLGVVIENLDFSLPGFFALASTAAGKSPNNTPTKWNKKQQQQQQRPMGNLTNVVHFLAKMVAESSDITRRKEVGHSVAPVLSSLIDSLSYLFAHINGPLVVSAVVKTLSPALVSLIQGANARDDAVEKNKLFTRKMIQKVEKLWLDLLTCLQSRHGGPFDSELLRVMSSLLEATLCHSKRQFKHQTVLFWNATFALSSSLEYPEHIRPVLQSAKEKMSLHLPNWHNVEVPVTDNVCDEAEEATQDSPESRRPLGILGSPLRRNPLLSSGGSPKLLKGSFLHKAAGTERAVERLSPKPFLSPSSAIQRKRSSPGKPHARRKLPLSLYEDDHQEYVAIAPSPKKTRLLTEHQKEVMKAKRVIPAMYNVLDQSQDGTQFSSFTQDATQASPTRATQEEASQESILPSDTGKMPAGESGEEEARVGGDHQESASLLTRDVEHDVTAMTSDVFARDQVEDDQLADPAARDCTENDAEPVSGVPDWIEVGQTQERDVPRGVDGEKCPDTKVAGSTVTPETMETERPDEAKHSKRVDQEAGKCDPAEGNTSAENTRDDEEMQATERSGILARIPSSPRDKPHDLESANEVTPSKEEQPEAVTSPDVIPCSQTSSSLDSPFQSLRRVSIPLPMVSLSVRKSAGHSNKSVERETSPEEIPDSSTESAPAQRTTTDKPSSENTAGESCTADAESMVSEKDEESLGLGSPGKDEASISRSAAPKSNPVSPVAGRTRRRVRNKTEDSTPARKARLSRSKKKAKAESEDGAREVAMETAAAPLVALQVGKASEMNCSPVSSPKIKFIRSQAIAATPSHGHLRAVHSPSVSPSGGILKRFPVKQAVDSPSPPGKVRRVSFALPPQSDKSSKATEPPAKIGTAEEPSKETTPKESSRQAFTAIKPRAGPTSSTPSAPSAGEDCMCPDLVQCKLPVEKVLPSLTTNWSRGIGLLVHAQNIRTVGNLSALKEHQVRNLPIKSPKVETLKRVLRNFHQSQQKTRGSRDRPAGLISSRRESVDQSACAREDPCNVDVKQLEMTVELKGDEPLTRRTKDSRLEEDQLSEKDEPINANENEDQEEKSYTPPLSTNAAENLGAEIQSAETPKRIPGRQPTLFASRLKACGQSTSQDREEVREQSERPTDEALLCSEESSHPAEAKEGLEETQLECADFEPLPRPSLDSEVRDEDQTEGGSAVSTPESRKGPESSSTSKASGEQFCETLNSALLLASSDTLESLSSDNIFRAHQTLTELMNKVGSALRSKSRSPKQC